MSTEKEVSLKELPSIIGNLFTYLLHNWKWILLITIIAGLLGVLYAWKKKAIYTAEITFAPENEKASSMGMYAGIAAQFGIELGGSGGGAFEGENLMQFLKSKMLIEKTLLSPIDAAKPGYLVIHEYLKMADLEDDKKVKNINFSVAVPPNRQRDSMMNLIVKNVRNDLIIDKVDKKLNIVSVKLSSTDEIFAKEFVVQLVENGINYYVDYRSKKNRENVQILQRQTDSVRRTLRGGIVSVAASTDLNINPVKQVLKANVQNRQVDVQVNGQLYGELLKQLELSKISLRKETPLVQIIDTPRYPLEKTKMGRLKAGVVFATIGGVVSVLMLLFKRMMSTNPTYHRKEISTITINEAIQR